jgi:hypothetical protein
MSEINKIIVVILNNCGMMSCGWVEHLTHRYTVTVTALTSPLSNQIKLIDTHITIIDHFLTQ